MFDSKFRGMGERKGESSVFSSPNSRLARGACTLADQLSKSSSYHDLYLKVDNLNHKVLFLVWSKWFFNWSFFFLMLLFDQVYFSPLTRENNSRLGKSFRKRKRFSAIGLINVRCFEFTYIADYHRPANTTMACSLCFWKHVPCRTEIIKKTIVQFKEWPNIDEMKRELSI